MNMQGRISPSLKALLRKMLAFNPNQRNSLAEIIENDAWFNSLN
jgi:serine/threonine protein kinase